jgi:Polysaccharide biosynthesis protein
MLQREMRFTTLSVISMLGSFVGTLIAITGALAGYGYWSLVAMTVATPLIITMGSTRPKVERSGPHFSPADTYDLSLRNCKPTGLVALRAGTSRTRPQDSPGNHTTDDRELYFRFALWTKG